VVRSAVSRASHARLLSVHSTAGRSNVRETAERTTRCHRSPLTTS
jgi:hypothetical protein